MHSMADGLGNTFLQRELQIIARIVKEVGNAGGALADIPVLDPLECEGKTLLRS
jgi:hypothetical protein